MEHRYHTLVSVWCHQDAQRLWTQLQCPKNPKRWIPTSWPSENTFASFQHVIWCSETSWERSQLPGCEWDTIGESLEVFWLSLLFCWPSWVSLAQCWKGKARVWVSQTNSPGSSPGPLQGKPNPQVKKSSTCSTVEGLTHAVLACKNAPNMLSILPCLKTTRTSLQNDSGWIVNHLVYNDSSRAEPLAWNSPRHQLQVLPLLFNFQLLRLTLQVTYRGCAAKLFQTQNIPSMNIGPSHWLEVFEGLTEPQWSSNPIRFKPNHLETLTNSDQKHVCHSLSMLSHHDNWDLLRGFTCIFEASTVHEPGWPTDTRPNSSALASAVCAFSV